MNFVIKYYFIMYTQLYRTVNILRESGYRNISPGYSYISPGLGTVHNFRLQVHIPKLHISTYPQVICTRTYNIQITIT